MNCPHCNAPNARLEIPFDATVAVPYNPDTAELADEATLIIGQRLEVAYRWTCCGQDEDDLSIIEALEDACENTVFTGDYAISLRDLREEEPAMNERPTVHDKHEPVYTTEDLKLAPSGFPTTAPALPDSATITLLTSLGAKVGQLETLVEAALEFADEGDAGWIQAESDVQSVEDLRKMAHEFLGKQARTSRMYLFAAFVQGVRIGAEAAVAELSGAGHRIR